jgi:hypothetical protein
MIDWISKIWKESSQSCLHLKKMILLGTPWIRWFFAQVSSISWTRRNSQSRSQQPIKRRKSSASTCTKSNLRDSACENSQSRSKWRILTCAAKSLSCMVAGADEGIAYGLPDGWWWAAWVRWWTFAWFPAWLIARMWPGNRWAIVAEVAGITHAPSISTTIETRSVV